MIEKYVGVGVRSDELLVSVDYFSKWRDVPRGR